jgi:hypothetical protein
VQTGLISKTLHRWRKHCPDRLLSCRRLICRGRGGWQYLRANWRAISVFDSYEAIVDAFCIAWNRFANDPATVTSITTRTWANVK